MSAVNLDAIIQMYLSQHGEKAKKRYEALFAFPEKTKDDGPATSEHNEDGDQPHDDAERQEQVSTDEDGTVPVYEFLGFRPSDEIVGMLEDAYFDLDDCRRVYAEVAMETVDNPAWRQETALEAMANWLDVRSATHLFHALQPEGVFPIDARAEYQRLRDRLRVLGIQFKDHTDDEDLLPIDIVDNISDAVADFRTRKKLEPWQVWTLVYDLAPRLLPPLPPYPSGEVTVWVTGANANVFRQADEVGPSDSIFWTICRKAKRGDLILMYHLTPRRFIDSVYRVDLDAYKDPFANWYGGYWTSITDKLPLPKLTLSEMRGDPVLKEWNLVKTNFQGMQKTAVPATIWNRIKTLVSERDPTVGELLAKYQLADAPIRGLDWSEREFEDKVLLPLLQRLGWQPGTTLAREHEMWIKVGSDRPKKVRADVVGMHDALTSEVLMVIETKRKITSDAELKSAREQCESYCGKLRCSRFAVAAPEGIWVYDLRFPTQSELLVHVRSPSVNSPGIEKQLVLLSFAELSKRGDGRTV